MRMDMRNAFEIEGRGVMGEEISDVKPVMGMWCELEPRRLTQQQSRHHMKDRKSENTVFSRRLSLLRSNTYKRDHILFLVQHTFQSSTNLFHEELSRSQIDLAIAIYLIPNPRSSYEFLGEPWPLFFPLPPPPHPHFTYN
ncbi:hypothetical protein ACRALDRAFT_1092348 [Sodiomyces alcalophilus JCM 7366]|uniref:uncharacterized protein n=1 Tax=Sodiomyces alcalophilus JCM 7366 TaxID=591952 RepID=UPI0039B52858